MAMKKAGKTARKKTARRTTSTRKVPAKKRAAAKKAARLRKAAPRKTSARKAAAKKPRKVAARKASARKVKVSARAAKAPARKAPPGKSRKAPAKPRKAPAPPVTALFVEEPEPTAFVAPDVEMVETTSAGIQPLAPEHAAVDELTSSGNELLDIFQRYDRQRTGHIEHSGFARLLEALGQNITDDELMIALDVVDPDRTGTISWMQFKTWWTSR
ncbi:EF-hand domain-containing protein [Corallococcus sp. M34]|uniref:EF-hand domain-containing protein n=1 Tax=Citreicoccus inhibens TaxID=2849499 RepID=UPI001C21E4FC|nr:EF-hand domain-containing protein [Citreicoccus inhibens]MBU8894504.1 EF-hand domain-containing protein [Citreicoccus inhibens]